MPTDSKMACVERIYIGIGITKWRRRENFEGACQKEKITSINCIMRTFLFNLPISTVIVEEVERAEKDF